jgi:hypothetical protein
MRVPIRKYKSIFLTATNNCLMKKILRSIDRDTTTTSSFDGRLEAGSEFLIEWATEVEKCIFAVRIHKPRTQDPIALARYRDLSLPGPAFLIDNEPALGRSRGRVPDEHKPFFVRARGRQLSVPENAIEFIQPQCLGTFRASGT